MACMENWWCHGLDDKVIYIREFNLAEYHRFSYIFKILL